MKQRKRKTPKRPIEIELPDILKELRRVAAKLGQTSLSRNDFQAHGRLSRSIVESRFGGWNAAVAAAGLRPLPKSGSNKQTLDKTPDGELLKEIVQLTTELGRKPTKDLMTARGRFDPQTYAARWGSWEKALSAADEMYGFPDLHVEAPGPSPQRAVAPVTDRTTPRRRRRRVLYGEPIDFRGLRHAPLDEHGVAFLFGMISRELGFLIESVDSQYPHCRGKRSVDPDGRRWESVSIQFEAGSSSFRERGFSPEECDLIVCWLHDWDDCPIDVLELRSRIGNLPKLRPVGD